MKLYAGIDLHGDNSVAVAAIDEQDRMVLEKRIGSDLAMLVERQSRFQAWLVGVVFQSTSKRYWLVDGLMQAGQPLYLANTPGNEQ